MNARTVAAAIALVCCASAHAATAHFTGRMHQVQSVTGNWVWSCQYQYGGQMFWRDYSPNCPSSIEIE